jgi:hypothetical protein
MVEGGTQVLNFLIQGGLWDEARIEVSPRRVGQGVAAPAIGGCVASRLMIDGNIITRMLNAECISIPGFNLRPTSNL